MPEKENEKVSTNPSINTVFQEPATFVNPFEQSQTTNRFVSNVDSLIYDWYYSIHPSRGTQQTTINILLLKLRNELIRRGITDFTKEHEFELFVTECHFISREEFNAVNVALPGILGSPITRSDGETRSGEVVRSDDIGREKRAGQIHPPVANRGTIIPSGVGKGLGGVAVVEQQPRRRNLAVKTKKTREAGTSGNKSTTGKG